MKPIASSLQGATPELNVKPLDPAAPICGKTIAGDVACTRGKGHYGACGVKTPEPEPSACA